MVCMRLSSLYLTVLFVAGLSAAGAGGGLAQVAPQPASPAAIDTAANLLAAGKAAQAATVLTTAVTSGTLSPALMARALYLRGKAYRAQGQPALAIADFNNALWMKGVLSDADKADATEQRIAAHAEAGLGDGKQAMGAKPPVQQQANTNVPASKNTVATLVPMVAPKTAPPVKPAAVSSTGGYHTRLTLVRTQAEAEAVVAKLKVSYAAAIADRSPEIGQVSFGNMGTFFQVRLGPFASAADAQSQCQRLKGSGLDCVPVTK